MPIIIEAVYAKKVGLPGYSSLQFGVTLRTELTDLAQLEKTTVDLYQRLQAAVDAQIVNPGLVPATPGAPAPRAMAPVPGTDEPQWRCSDKQRDLILKIVAEHALDKTEVDQLAQERFGAGVRALNKLQASSLIDELLETYASQNRRGGRARPIYNGRAPR
jgi:hypothetical protein